VKPCGYLVQSIKGRHHDVAAHAGKTRKTRKGVPLIGPDPFLDFLDFPVVDLFLKKAAG